MRPIDRSERLREVGLIPTIQRLAVLECLYKTRQHPTADEVLSAVRQKFPSISRATVYNTLDALTKAGMVFRLNVDPTVARYDADLGPHAHFRCRICRKVYDIEVQGEHPIGVRADGHLIESVRTYAYGVCASCRANGESVPARSQDDRKGTQQTKELKASSPASPDPSDRNESARTKEARNA
jgi:Fur family peroxide stress response transcriptional regulator